jgi:hypothetical protein
MKRTVTKDQLIEYIKKIDTRCKKWDESDFDRAITNGFAFMSTIIDPISTVYYEDLTPYYEYQETSFSINLLGSVEYVYDMYLGINNFSDEQTLEHKILKIRDTNRIWKDPSKDDVIHVDLNDTIYGHRYDFVEIKYLYIPIGSDFDELLLPNQIYVVLEACISAASYDALNSPQEYQNKMNLATMLSTSASDIYPNDYYEPGTPNKFPNGV